MRRTARLPNSSRFRNDPQMRRTDGTCKGVEKRNSEQEAEGCGRTHNPKVGGLNPNALSGLLSFFAHTPHTRPNSSTRRQRSAEKSLVKPQVAIGPRTEVDRLKWPMNCRTSQPKLLSGCQGCLEVEATPSTM